MKYLNNITIFLNKIQRHLKKDGLFIITTPDPISPSFFYQRIISGKITDVSVWNHTHWYTHGTLIELLRIYNFELLKSEYIPNVGKMVWKIIPDIFGRSLFMIAKVK